MNERSSYDSSAVHDRAMLLNGSKRNQVMSLAEIEQYGLDSFADANYISIYGMPPREWYRHGIRLLGRTAVECTRDMLSERIGRDVASVAKRMSANRVVVIDPFAGSCNTLFWILRHLSNAEGIAFESDHKVVMRDDVRCGQHSVVSRKVGIACEHNVITQTSRTSASGVHTIFRHASPND